MEKITGILLAGGKSTRFGKDKGLLKWKGNYLADIPLGALKDCFQNVMINSNNPDYKFFGLPVFEDELRDIGPIGGIIQSLTIVSTEYIFVLACDMPNIDKKVINYLVSNLNDNNIVVPVTEDGMEPLCAIYSKKCLPVIKEMIKIGDFKLINLFNKCEKVLFLTLASQLNGFEKEKFVNINYPIDIEKYGEDLHT